MGGTFIAREILDHSALTEVWQENGRVSLRSLV